MAESPPGDAGFPWLPAVTAAGIPVTHEDAPVWGVSGDERVSSSREVRLDHG